MIKKACKYFTKNKLLTFIIAIPFIAIALFIFNISFDYKSLLLSRIFPFIFITLGFSFFRLALFNDNNSLLITVFKTFILLCTIIIMEIILDGIKISTNLRSLIVVISFCLLSNVFYKAKTTNKNKGYLK